MTGCNHVCLPLFVCWIYRVHNLSEYLRSRTTTFSPTRYSFPIITHLISVCVLIGHSLVCESVVSDFLSGEIPIIFHGITPTKTQNMISTHSHPRPYIPKTQHHPSIPFSINIQFWIFNSLIFSSGALHRSLSFILNHIRGGNICPTVSHFALCSDISFGKLWATPAVLLDNITRPSHITPQSILTPKGQVWDRKEATVPSSQISDTPMHNFHSVLNWTILPASSPDPVLDSSDGSEENELGKSVTEDASTNRPNSLKFGQCCMKGRRAHKVSIDGVARLTGSHPKYNVWREGQWEASVVTCAWVIWTEWLCTNVNSLYWMLLGAKIFKMKVNLHKFTTPEERFKHLKDNQIFPLPCQANM